MGKECILWKNFVSTSGSESLLVPLLCYSLLMLVITLHLHCSWIGF